MELSDYIIIIASSFAVFVVFLLPFIVAAIIGRNVPRRKLFTFVCGVFSYGLGGLTAIILGPVEVLATLLSPKLHIEGHSTIWSILHGVSDILEVAALVMAVVMMFLVPLHSSKGLWQKVCEALASHANKTDETTEGGSR